MKNVPFGIKSNKRVYVSIENEFLSIKSGGLAFFNAASTTKENKISLKNISSFEINTPVNPAKWNIKIIQTSGAIFFIPIFGNSQINEAKKIKEYIENYQSNNNSSQPNKYNELKQLKKLLDDNIITEDEFKKEKEKILN